MTPVSRVVNVTQVSSEFDPPLVPHSILIKWHPLTGGDGSWDEEDNYALITPVRKSIVVSWLVRLSSQEIIVQGTA